MSETEAELSELVGCPAALVSLETEACGVHQRDDSEGHAAIREIDTADATVILDLHAKVVIIRDFLGVAGSLDTSHHESVLWGDILLDTLLLL